MANKKNSKLQKKSNMDLEISQDLLNDLRFLIEQTKTRVAQTVNSELVLLYWKIGKRIKEDILKNERAEYGKEIFSTLSGKLKDEFGRGFSQQNLFRMVQFFDNFSDFDVVQSLSSVFIGKISTK